MADISRNTTNIALPQENLDEIWGKVLEESVFMRLARQISIPGTGVTIQTITGEPIADWVNETGTKPVSAHTFGKKPLVPHKLAVIEAFSNEFRRDLPALYAELVRRLPFALANKFDSTIMGTVAPGSGFDVLGGCTKQGIGGKTYNGFIAADAAISAASGIMNGIALAPQGKSIVLGATDTTGRPLFTADATQGQIGTILGAPVNVAKALYVAGSGSAANVVGIAGDFTDAVYGTVEDIQMSISDQATLGTGDDAINLWQNNMFAVRAEVEVAFAVRDAGEFVLLTDATVA